MELLFAWAVVGAFAYGVLSPDKHTLKATRGSAGAISGLRKYAGSSSKKGGKGKPRSYYQAARQGWRQETKHAAKKRATGKDLYSRGLQIAGFTGRRAADVKEGYETAKDWSIYHFFVRPAVDSAGRKNYEEEVEEFEKGEPDTEPDTIEDETDTTTEGKKNMVNKTDLAKIDMYIQEAEQIKTGAAELLDAQKEIDDWTGDIADRYAAATWGSTGLSAANADIAENSRDYEALIVSLDAAIEEANKLKQLGELADELGAEGDLDSYRSA